MKVNKAVIGKALVLLVLPIVLTLIAFYIYREFFFDSWFLNKVILKKDMEFKYFTWAEFDSVKGSQDNGKTYYKKGRNYLVDSGKDNFSKETILLLENARDIIENGWNALHPNNKINFVINSGYRTDSHNSSVGGVVNSAHRNKNGNGAKAVDISWGNYNQEQKINIEAALRQVGFNRIGKASSFIHVDNDSSLPQNVNWTY